jgi:hypothetical protein
MKAAQIKNYSKVIEITDIQKPTLKQRKSGCKRKVTPYYQIYLVLTVNS